MEREECIYIYIYMYTVYIYIYIYVCRWRGGGMDGEIFPVYCRNVTSDEAMATKCHTTMKIKTNKMKKRIPFKETWRVPLSNLNLPE